jgi:hypothetical protein
MSAYWKNRQLVRKQIIFKKPFTAPMTLLLYHDTLLSLQHKNSLNGMLGVQEACVQKVHKGFPILEQRMP